MPSYGGTNTFPRPQAAVDVGGETFAERLELLDAHLRRQEKPDDLLIDQPPATAIQIRLGRRPRADGIQIPASWWEGDPSPEALGSRARTYAVDWYAVPAASLREAEAQARHIAGLQLTVWWRRDRQQPGPFQALAMPVEDHKVAVAVFAPIEGPRDPSVNEATMFARAGATNLRVPPATTTPTQ